MKQIILLAFICLSLGCTNTVTETPLATPIYLRIGFEPALEPWAIELSRCAEEIPEVRLGFFETTSFIFENQPNFNLFIQYSNMIVSDSFTTRIDSEKLTWIVNAGNQINELTSNQIIEIFDGKIDRWSLLSDQVEEAPIELWIYPQGNPLNDIFEDLFLQSRATLSSAFLAPDPKAMVEAISSNPWGLGYLPEKWILEHTPAEIKQVPVIGDNLLNFEKPLDILASTPNEPQQETLQLLLCLVEKAHSGSPPSEVKLP